MAISLFNSAQVPTNLAYVWREQMKESDWAFNGFSAECFDSPLDCLVQTQAGRDEINRGMSEAYQKLSNALAYYPIAQRVAHRLTVRGSIPFSYEFHLPTNRLINLGKSAKTRLTSDSGAAVTYSKSDEGLSYNDVATISLATGASIDEISVRFKTSDCPITFVNDERLEIKPLVFETDGSTLTIRGHASLFAIPSLHFAENEQVLDMSESGNFVTHVHIYQESVDYEIQGELYQLDNSTLIDTIDVEIVDENFGLCIIPAYSTTFTNVILRVYAYSGAPLVFGAVDTQLAFAMTHLCNALMPEYPRNVSNQVFENFAKDREEIETVEAQGALERFGSIRRGALLAWQTAKSLRLRTWA